MLLLYNSFALICIHFSHNKSYVRANIKHSHLHKLEQLSTACHACSEFHIVAQYILLRTLFRSLRLVNMHTRYVSCVYYTRS